MQGDRRVVIDASSPEETDLLDRAAQKFCGAAAGVDRFLLAASAVAFVATDGSSNEIIGWCWGYFLPRPDGDAMAYVHELEVDDRHQGQGVGKALLRSFAAAVAERGASKMFLTTGAGNKSARSLYDSLGGGLAEQGPTVSYWFRLPLA